MDAEDERLPLGAATWEEVVRPEIYSVQERYAGSACVHSH